MPVLLHCKPHAHTHIAHIHVHILTCYKKHQSNVGYSVLTKDTSTDPPIGRQQLFFLSCSHLMQRFQTAQCVKCGEKMTLCTLCNIVNYSYSQKINRTHWRKGKILQNICDRSVYHNWKIVMTLLAAGNFIQDSMKVPFYTQCHTFSYRKWTLQEQWSENCGFF